MILIGYSLWLRGGEGRDFNEGVRGEITLSPFGSLGEWKDFKINLLLYSYTFVFQNISKDILVSVFKMF